MRTQDEIQKLLIYLRDDYYGNLRREQETDKTYYDDTFKVPWIKNPKKIQRTGKGARMVDSPAEHIITSNPVAYYDNGNHDSSIRVNTALNHQISIMKRRNPNPPKQFAKNMIGYPGEGWLRVMHNEEWRNNKHPEGSPILYFTPNPLIVFASPNEDENGVPEYVILHYERMPFILSEVYPKWSKAKDKPGKMVKFTEFISKDQHYAEVDGETVRDQKNVYKFVPFVHKLSGFGTDSPEAKPEEMIMGRLRKVRSLLERKTAMVSNVDSVIHLFANESLDFIQTQERLEPPPGGWEAWVKGYEMGAGLAHFIPWGIEVKRGERIQPDQALLMYMASIDAELEREDPLVMAGSPMGEGGRQQDMVTASAMKRYETIAENTEYAFSVAMGMGLRLMDTITGLRPDGIRKDDIKGHYNCRVELKASDPIESDRKATLGSRLYQMQQIDLRTNLIEYQGKTPEGADEIIIQMMVDKVTFQSPEIAQLIGMKAAQELGMEDELLAMRQMNQQMGAQAGQMGVQTGQGRPSEVQTEQGREMVDLSLEGKGMRNPPRLM